jgi:hypothetical protein
MRSMYRFDLLIHCAASLVDRACGQSFHPGRAGAGPVDAELLAQSIQGHLRPGGGATDSRSDRRPAGVGGALAKGSSARRRFVRTPRRSSRFRTMAAIRAMSI